MEDRGLIQEEEAIPELEEPREERDRIRPDAARLIAQGIMPDFDLPLGMNQPPPRRRSSSPIASSS